MIIRRTLLASTGVIALTAIGVFFVQAAQTPATPEVLSVQVNRPGAAMSPSMFGVFFEDINFGADGGLYPERVKNRSFEFTEPLCGWTKVDRDAEGELIIRTESPLNSNNQHYLQLHVYDPGPGYGVTNGGFRGMGAEAGVEFIVSAYVRVAGNGPSSLLVTLLDESNKSIGETRLGGFTSEWKKVEASLRPTATSSRAKLRLTVQERGDVDLDMVSVYPKETFKGRQNGLRQDLAQLLADLKPGFLRFPGGCIVEGRRLALAYDWKSTVGDVGERKSLVNRWNDEFNHRPTPDYFQSFGLGFYEYFQLAEDIGASPLPILNCGMACQFNSSETVPMDKLDPYIQDALDLVEFANGPVESKWGAIRAKMGHPAPFNMKLLGIGNEQWGPRYVERYGRFATAIKSRYPEIQLVSSAGPGAQGKEFDYLWSNMKPLKADIMDEHYYMAPQWFLNNTSRYDKYDRQGPKVFAGEYAAQTSGVARPTNRNNWESAIAEAAFITGLERNADVVTMASYAPLFAHTDAWQWTPNLIWFDNLRSFGTPNYYVQKLYSTNTGTHILPIQINGSQANAQRGLYTSALLDRRTGDVIVKAVNVTSSVRPVSLKLEGADGLETNARLSVLANAELMAENSLDNPKRLSPIDSTVATAGGNFKLDLPAYSMTVLRVKARL